MVPEDRTVRKIVQSVPGPGTCETHYIDEYGGVWIPAIDNSDRTCIPLRGRVMGNAIVTGTKFR